MQEMLSRDSTGQSDIEVDYLFVDNAAMQIIQSPKQFDVIVTGNMFGDILSGQGSAIAGSIGLLPSSSVGIGHAMFAPIHGSYTQAKGKNIANPVATIPARSGWGTAPWKRRAGRPV